MIAFYFYISEFAKTMMKGRFWLQRIEQKINRGFCFGLHPVYINILEW